MQKDDTQKLIDYSVAFATKMLADNQEFFPFAVTVNLKGDLITTGYFDGDDHPLSQDLINKLQLLLDRLLDNKERRAYALTYDVKVKKDNSSEKSDAIAVKIKHTDTKDSTIYYFSYKLTPRKTIEHLDSWAQLAT